MSKGVGISEEVSDVPDGDVEIVPDNLDRASLSSP